ncbi:transposase [Pseudomonas sp. RIT-PI-AD]|uniref:REP-associated tyrosine transposase n=1 Tax=Pseudomonas sp. RIT-PI-AD TaxID=3035294 RepID=UPI00320A00D3
MLTTRTARREPFFTQYTAARLLVGEMRALHEGEQVASLAWVVMPDHLHGLVRARALGLDELMRLLEGRSARRIDQHLGLRGAVWQDGYHDRALRRDEDLRDVARYVLANPLRAGLVRRIGDYPGWDAVWS